MTKIKIFSVHANEDFSAIRIGNETRTISANEYLEREIQKFLDESPQIEIKYLQYSSTPIIPKTASWNTTNSPIDWEIEKCVIVLYQENG